MHPDALHVTSVGINKDVVDCCYKHDCLLGSVCIYSSLPLSLSLSLSLSIYIYIYRERGGELTYVHTQLQSVLICDLHAHMSQHIFPPAIHFYRHM